MHRTSTWMRRRLLAQYLTLVVNDGNVVILEDLRDLVTAVVKRLLNHSAPGVFSLPHSHRYAEIKTNTRLGLEWQYDQLRRCDPPGEVTTDRSPHHNCVEFALGKVVVHNFSGIVIRIGVQQAVVHGLVQK